MLHGVVYVKLTNDFDFVLDADVIMRELNNTSIQKLRCRYNIEMIFFILYIANTPSNLSCIYCFMVVINAEPPGYFFFFPR